MILRKRIFRILMLCGFAFGIAILGVSFAQGGQESAAQQPPAAASGIKDYYEGIVKIAVGKYLYLPAAQGFDVVIQGAVEGQDASSLIGKDIRLKGSLLQNKPSVLVADSIDIKDAGGQYRNIFTRAEEVKVDDHLDTNDRATFAALKITNANKNEEWEGKGKVRIYGKLAADTAAGKESYAILLSDDKGKEVGRILIDNVTDYARYYLKKLRLFDQFWFYLNIKETVDAKTRRKTRELFHADLLLAGLF